MGIEQLKNETLGRMFAFIEALNEAEQKGEKSFVCPVCGGTATWNRSSYNNHIHSHCKDCGMRLIE